MSWECPRCSMLWSQDQTCASCGYDRQEAERPDGQRRSAAPPAPPPPPPDPTPAIRCALCSSARVGRVDSLPDVSGASFSYQAIGIRWAVYESKESITGKRPRHFDFPAKVGTMECIVCTDCGLLERYVQDLHWTPLQGLEGFEHVGSQASEQVRRPSPFGRRAMKSGTCSKCHSKEVGRLGFLPDTGKTETVAYRRFAGLREDGLLVGELEAYVCGTCGYLETYVKRPEDVPFDDIVAFSWINSKTENRGPYR